MISLSGVATFPVIRRFSQKNGSDSYYPLVSARSDKFEVRFGKSAVKETIPCLGEGLDALEPYLGKNYFHGTSKVIEGDALLPHAPAVTKHGLYCRDEKDNVLDRSIPIVFASPVVPAAIYLGLKSGLPEDFPPQSAGMYSEKKTVDSDPGKQYIVYHFAATPQAIEHMKRQKEIRLYVCETASFQRDVPGLTGFCHRISLESVKPSGYVLIKNPAQALKTFGVDIDNLPPVGDRKAENYKPRYATIRGSFTTPQPSY